MKSVFLGLAVVAAMMFGGVTAQAGFINGGTSFSVGNLQNPGSGTVLDVRNASTVFKSDAGTLDFAQAPLFTFWDSFQFQNPMVSPFVLSNATFGTFTSSALLSDNLDSGIIAGAGNRTITFAGSFQAGSLFSANVQDLTNANLTITLNQSTTGANTSFASFVTLTAFGESPVAIPEPTSIALFGLGALGLVARRFRRK